MGHDAPNQRPVQGTSEPVQVTDMDLGITYVHGVIKLPAQGIDQGENPCPCREVHTTAKADWKIT